jgi:hypothetical protein
MAVRVSVEDRFWAKVETVPFHECWEWVGAVQSGGYGNIRVAGRNLKAHRLSFELNVGPIPEGLVIDHTCRNRACVRPEHLEAVTQRVNVLRGDSKMARNAVQTHCVNRHEFTPENTKIDSHGRHCRACALKRDRDRYALKRKG